MLNSLYKLALLADLSWYPDTGGVQMAARAEGARIAEKTRWERSRILAP